MRRCGAGTWGVCAARSGSSQSRRRLRPGQRAPVAVALALMPGPQLTTPTQWALGSGAAVSGQKGDSVHPVHPWAPRSPQVEPMQGKGLLLFSGGKAAGSWGASPPSADSHLPVTSMAGGKVTASPRSPTENRSFSLDLAQCFCC